MPGAPGRCPASRILLRVIAHQGATAIARTNGASTAIGARHVEPCIPILVPLDFCYDINL